MSMLFISYSTTFRPPLQSTAIHGYAGKHPAVKNHQNEAKHCVSHPEVIRASAKDPDVHLHYSPLEGGRFVCVVVAPAMRPSDL